MLNQTGIDMQIKFIDAHTHVQFSAFDEDRDAVISRAQESGIAIINAGTKKETSQSAVELAHKYENVYATVGLHPVHASHSTRDEEEVKREEANPEDGFDYEFYKRLALDPKVVAIGECGLDYYRITDNELRIKEKQKEAFIQQIRLAHEVKKPLMIHCRDAMNDLISLLTTNYSLLTNPPGIMHFFSGTTDEAKKLLDMGFYFTFGGVITFTRDYDEVVRTIPIGRILSETDAPYVAPVPHRGKRNEPAYVVEVVKKLAELKKVSVETITNQILKNAGSVFNINVAA